MIARLKIRLLRRFLARHRFLLFVETVLVWLLFVAAIFYAISFFVIPKIAESSIQKRCGGAVDIQSGRFSGIGAIRLDEVVIAEDSRAIGTDPILQADRIEVRFDPWQLLKGRFVIRSVTLSDFLLSADYDPSEKKWNFGGLSLPTTQSSDNPIPLVRIHQGALRFRQKHDQDSETLATVSMNGRLFEPTGANDYGFLLETDGRFGFGPSRLQGSLQCGGEEEKARLSVTGQITMPAAGILQNKWDLRDIRLTAEFDKQTIAVNEFTFAMGPGNGRVDARIGCAGNYPMELNIALHGLSLSDRYDPGTVSYGWLVDASDSGFARFLKRFNPVGAGELDLSITSDLKDLAQSRIDGQIMCRDIAVRDKKFPYQIDKMRGPILFEGRVIRLNKLQAQHQSVDLLLDGWVDNTKAPSVIDFHVTSPNMRFDEDLFRSLSEGTQKAWYDFTPTGLAEIDYHYWHDVSGQEGKELSLELKNATATYKHFPYPLSNLTGRIVLRPQQLLIEDVLASDGTGGQIKVSGRVLQPDIGQSVFEVRIQGKEVPVDQQLLRALPEKYGPFFDRLQIDQADAVSDFEVTVFPDQADDRFLDYSAEIKVRAAAFRHDDFPLSVTDAVLAATIASDAVWLDSFQGQTQCGPIRIGRSRLWSQGADPKRPGFCLELDIKDFDLNETFWTAVGPGTRQKFRGLGLRGRINATGPLAVNVPDAEKSSNLVIDCNSNPLTWDDIVIANANGRLVVQNGLVSFSALRVADIDLEKVPKELMNDNVRSIWTKFSPTGRTDIHFEEGSVKIDAGQIEDVMMKAGVRTGGVSFGDTNAPGDLDGTVQGDFEWDAETNKWYASARYDVGQLRYRDHLATSLAGTLVFDPNLMLLKSDGFSASLCGGNVSGYWEINMRPNQTPGYALELNYDGVDVQQLLTESESSQQRITQGLAAGRLALKGNIGDYASSRGTLDTMIIDLKMGRQSLLGKILTAVQLKRPENFVFSEIDLNAAILGPEIVLSRIRMLGNPLIFYGQGRVNFQNRQVQLNLASWDSQDAHEDSILDALARGIGSALWKIQVDGTLEAPQVDAVYLSVLKQPLDIFGGDK